LNLHDLAVTRPSTLRVYQFRHQRVGGHCSGADSSVEDAEEQHGVQAEEHRNNQGQPRQVPLDYVRAALGGRREPDPAETGVTPRVHQDQRDERGGEQHLEDGEHLDHAARDGSNGYVLFMAAGDEARAKIQRLLVTGDNRLKQGVAPEKVRESYEQALAAAREAGLEDAVRPLVEIRLADLERLGRSE
jgi:hypothetical protein